MKKLTDHVRYTPPAMKMLIWL